MNNAMQGQRAAVWLVGGFLVLITIATGTVVLDRARRGELERVEQRSAVEDTALMTLPADYPGTAPFPAVAVFGNSHLVPVEREPVELRDDYMIRQGLESTGNYSVYRYLPESTKREREPDFEHFYLKVGRDLYLKTRPVSAAP